MSNDSKFSPEKQSPTKQSITNSNIHQMFRELPEVRRNQMLFANLPEYQILFNPQIFNKDDHQQEHKEKTKFRLPTLKPDITVNGRENVGKMFIHELWTKDNYYTILKQTVFAEKNDRLKKILEHESLKREKEAKSQMEAAIAKKIQDFLDSKDIGKNRRQSFLLRAPSFEEDTKIIKPLPKSKYFKQTSRVDPISPIRRVLTNIKDLSPKGPKLKQQKGYMSPILSSRIDDANRVRVSRSPPPIFSNSRKSSKDSMSRVHSEESENLSRFLVAINQEFASRPFNRYQSPETKLKKILDECDKSAENDNKALMQIWIAKLEDLTIHSRGVNHFQDVLKKFENARKRDLVEYLQDVIPVWNKYRDIGNPNVYLKYQSLFFSFGCFVHLLDIFLFIK